MVWFWILFATVLLAGVLFHRSQKPKRDAVANIPGPFCFPVLGAFYILINLDPTNFLKQSHAHHVRYGSIVRFWIFNRIAIGSSDVELNEQLLTSPQHIVKQRNYRMLRPWLGTGLLLSDGRKWFTRRKIITPAFHFKILEQFVEVFDQQSTVLLKCLSSKADGQRTFDVYPFLCLATLDIIAETAMGTKVNAQMNSRNQYAAAVNKMTKLLAWRFTKIHLNNELAFTLLCPHLKWKQHQLLKIMHEFTTHVIEERRAALTKTLQTVDIDTSEEIEGSKKRMALLDVLLQSTTDGKPLSNEDIREEVDTFMFEGHDTTTSALSFALHLLSRHPAVQEKLLTEVLDVLGKDRERLVTLQDLNALKYTECVIKESLRMYPSVPIIGREIETDFKYTHSRVGDGIIPAGTEFVIALWGMLRDGKYFENPNDFVPERHLEGKAINAFSNIPFSAGPRNCIGQKFAMLEMKMVIAKIVREYELLPFGPEVEPELNIVMRSSTGFHLGMKKRI